MLHFESKQICAIFTTATLVVSCMLSACGGRIDPLSVARASVDSAYGVSADLNGTVVQTTDYSPVVANLYRDETKKISYHVDGDSDTRNMHVTGTSAINGADKQKENSYYVTTDDDQYFLYSESDDGKSYTSLKAESLPVTEFRSLIDAMANGNVKVSWSQDGSGKISDGALYRGDVSLEGDQLSYLNDWSRLVSTKPLGETTEPETADGTADVSVYINPQSGKLTAVSIQGKNLFRSALQLYGQTIYTTTSKYDLLVKFSDASDSKQIGLMPSEEKQKDVKLIQPDDYQKDRFDLVARKNTTELSLADIADAEWTDMRLTTGKQNFELPIAYRSVAEDWLFKDASLYNGYQLKDQEYTTVGMYSTILGNNVTFDATFSNDSGKTQDITDCTIVSVTMTQNGTTDNGFDLWLPKNITFGSVGGDIENAYGNPGDGNKVVGDGYSYTSYHYADQDYYLDMIVNDNTGLSSFTMGFITSGMQDSSNRVDTTIDNQDSENDASQHILQDDNQTLSSSSENTKNTDVTAGSFESVSSTS